MNRRIAPNAFELYVELGPGRSHQALAEKLGVSKKAVSRCAKREKWQERLEEVERKARERTDEKLVEEIEEMNTRHLKVLRFIQGRSIETMKSLPLTSAKDAVQAFLLSMEKERAVRGVGGEPEKDVQIIIQ
ncbi:MAG: hypothetical protein ACKVXR_03930 [Planctomycetota bacterium]